jgi:hypothetical protein
MSDTEMLTIDHQVNSMSDTEMLTIDHQVNSMSDTEMLTRHTVYLMVYC